MNSRKIELTKENLASSRVAKLFQERETVYSSLSFHDAGEYCVTAGEDDSLTVYNCREGNTRSTLYSKKYGVTLARFTHRKTNVIYASTKEDDTLRYLSIHDNKYIRYFRGHKKRVTAVEVSPVDDKVMTTSLDETVRFWDLRSSTCQGVITGKGKTLAAYDPQGLVFAVGTSCDTISLFDSREYTKGPFSTWKVEDAQFTPGRLPEWTSFKVTPDGKLLVVTTMSDIIYVFDAFDGKMVQRLVGHAGPAKMSCGEEVCITPDAKYVMAGGRDSYLRIWDITQRNVMDSQPFVTLPTPHKNGVRVAGYNPVNALAVSGGEELAFWLSTVQDEESPENN